MAEQITDQSYFNYGYKNLKKLNSLVQKNVV